MGISFRFLNHTLDSPSNDCYIDLQPAEARGRGGPSCQRKQNLHEDY